MTILVTGAAGFIGFHVASALLAEGHSVLGLDDLNEYYDVSLKQARLQRLQSHSQFEFLKLSLSETPAVEILAHSHPDIDFIIHLAAQAGVRYSLENPYAYIQANITGHVAILELARKLKNLKHCVYASSSSVYGGNQKLPFAPSDPVEQPLSIYAATKRCDELMSYSYSHLYQLPLTGLRFFTVYGPWGRPDMAAYIFTKALFEGRPIALYNRGQMRRNFTYVADIVQGTLACLWQPPRLADHKNAYHRIYNLGNDKTVPLTQFIALLEQISGREAQIQLSPLQLGDVPDTLADISKSRRDFGFDPKTDIEAGLEQFVAWYKDYHHVGV